MCSDRSSDTAPLTLQYRNKLYVFAYNNENLDKYKQIDA